MCRKGIVARKGVHGRKADQEDRDDRTEEPPIYLLHPAILPQGGLLWK